MQKLLQFYLGLEPRELQYLVRNVIEAIRVLLLMSMLCSALVGTGNIPYNSSAVFSTFVVQVLRVDDMRL